METGRNTRRIVVGLGSMVAGAALLVGALPGGAGAAPSQESTITSMEYDGNLDCSDFDYEFELKVDIEDPEEGDFDENTPGVETNTDTDLVVTITEADYSSDPAVISLTTSFPVSAVLVKAGPGGIIYEADPPTSTWTGLESPKDSISHITVCWDEEDETTTTTDKDTTTTDKDTTTTSEDTTTTTEDDETTTTTKGEETTTTVEGETTTTMAGVTTTTPGGELPRTGNSAGPLVALGALLLAGGTALVAGTKWKRAQQ